MITQHVCVGQDSGYKSLSERDVPAVWDDSWVMHEMFCVCVVSNISCYSFRCFKKHIFSAVSIRTELDSITSHLSTWEWKVRLDWSRFVWNAGRFPVFDQWTSGGSRPTFLFRCFLFYFVGLLLLCLTDLHFLSWSFFTSTSNSSLL